MDDEKLISLVQYCNFLYDKTDKNFKNPEMKKNAWETISKELNIPLQTCMRRWSALSERFSREIRDYVPSGSGSQQKAAWHLYSTMKPFVKPRRTKSSKNILETACADITMNSDSMDISDLIIPSSPVAESDSFAAIENSFEAIDNSFVSSLGQNQVSSEDLEPGTSSSKKRKATQSNIDNAFLEAVNCFKKVCDNRLKKENTAVEAFGSMVTSTVSEMNASKQAKAIKEVTALIMSIKEEPE